MIACRLTFYFVLPTCLLACFTTKLGFEKNNVPYIYEVCCDGHKHDDTADKPTCNPICQEDCENGTCIAPNHCKCYDGYKNTENNPSLGCEPICSMGCVGGRCVGPEMCECEHGFHLEEASGSCLSPDVDSNRTKSSECPTDKKIFTVFIYQWKYEFAAAILLCFVLMIVLITLRPRPRRFTYLVAKRAKQLRKKWYKENNKEHYTANSPEHTKLNILV